MGPCWFSPETDGTFSLSHGLDTDILENIGVVTVAVTGEGEAEIFGLTNWGNNSRWGSTKRSQADPACWQTSDAMVCARAR